MRTRIVSIRDELEGVEKDRLEFKQGYLQAFRDIEQFLSEGKV